MVGCDAVSVTLEESTNRADRRASEFPPARVVNTPNGPIDDLNTREFTSWQLAGPTQHTFGEPVNPRQPAADAAAEDAEWAGRLRAAASADVPRLLRTARRRRQARWLAVVLTLVVVAAVVTALVRTGALDGLLTEDTSGSPSAGAPAPTTARPASPMFDPTKPFASTPAADWPDGASGILTPTPRRVGTFSPDEVASALTRVRDVLVASRLDRALLVDHDPARYLSLLAPDARRQLSPLFHGAEPQVQSLVSMVAPGSRLLDVEPKVKGEMTVRVGEQGELVVTTNYVVVYAFEPDVALRLVDTMNAIVVVRADVEYVLRATDRWAEGSKGLWYGEATGYAYSIGCEAYQRGYLAPAMAERAVATQTDQSRTGYFDPASPAPLPSCPTG